MLGVIILAAGEGKRMKSDKAKVLHEICGRPMIDYVLEIAKMLAPAKIALVVGDRMEQVVSFLKKEKVVFCIQSARKGTAHAVSCADGPFLGFPGKILVLCGDMPLIKIETVRKLLGYHDEKKSSATVLTGIVENPGAYGRIARDADGELDSIVEFADADEKIRGIKEVNSGCYVFESEALWSSLSEIGSENAQGEYYLPDIIKLLKNKGATVAAFPADEPDELMGVNTPEELAQAEKIISSRRKG